MEASVESARQLFLKPLVSEYESQFSNSTYSEENEIHYELINIANVLQLHLNETDKAILTEAFVNCKNKDLIWNKFMVWVLKNTQNGLITYTLDNNLIKSVALAYSYDCLRDVPEKIWEEIFDLLSVYSDSNNIAREVYSTVLAAIGMLANRASHNSHNEVFLENVLLVTNFISKLHSNDTNLWYREAAEKLVQLMDIK